MIEDITEVGVEVEAEAKVKAKEEVEIEDGLKAIIKF